MQVMCMQTDRLTGRKPDICDNSASVLHVWACLEDHYFLEATHQDKLFYTKQSDVSIAVSCWKTKSVAKMYHLDLYFQKNPCFFLLAEALFVYISAFQGCYFRKNYLKKTIRIFN